jgi:class 3 adenylate cyclase/tetratricopeptide (TPR) repeat protein
MLGDQAARAERSGRRAECPSCGVAVDESARFCPSCGTAQLVAAPSQTDLPTGERRRLTILFCDLVDSTALSEQLDPEELGELVLAYQEMGRKVVTDFDGHVAQYLGDGLLVYFGYPTAHENDAERAVLAGLAILAGLAAINDRASARDVRLAARVGIHAGPAIVGEMGSTDRSDTSAFGSTPNIAARLEAFAAPDTVSISDEVRRFLDPCFEVVDRGTPKLKGITRSIRVWEVAGVGERAPRAAAHSDLPMIGRGREFGALLTALARADDGEPGLLVVMAEPGLGKTRLLQELYTHVESRGGTVWLEGQCSELTAATPLAPLIQFLRRTLALDELPSADERRIRLLDALAVLGPGSADAAHYLGELLGISVPRPVHADAEGDEGPELKRRRTLDTLAAWVRAVARDQTVLVVVEDLHWSDPTSVELVELLTTLPGALRVLCVCTARPDVELAWRAPDAVTTITLSPLGFEDAEHLTRSLATGRGLSADIVDALAQRSDGVPLFIEELVAAASEDDLAADPGEVPLTLQALLASRLDLLGHARPIAQAAAVLGREFSLPLLAAIAGMPADDLTTALERLVDSGIMTNRQVVGGVVYAFRHALIQDAAYGSLLRRHRRLLHESAATQLTTTFAQLVADSPEIVAHHLLGAERLMDSAAWYETAGRRAAERAALREARAHFEQGIRVIEALESSPARSQQMMSLHVLLGNTLMGSSGIGNDEAGPVWKRAIEFADEVGDAEEATAALNGLAVYHADRGEIAATEQCVDRILDIADRVGSRIARLRGHGTIAQVRLYQGRGREAREHVMHALSLSKEGDFFTVTYAIGHDQETFFHLVGSWTAWWLGRPDESLALAKQGLAIALRIPSSLSQAMARNTVAMAHHLRNEPAAAAAVARENLQFAIGLDFPFWRGIAQMLLGAQLARLADPDGVPMLEDGLDRMAAIGNLSGGSVGMLLLADAYFHSGRFDDAIGAADLGLASAATIDQPFCDTELLATKGRSLVALGRLDAGHAALEQSLATGRDQGALSATLQAALALFPLLAPNDPHRARSVLEEALTAMVDGADTPDQRAARAQLAGAGVSN